MPDANRTEVPPPRLDNRMCPDPEICGSAVAPLQRGGRSTALAIASILAVVLGLYWQTTLSMAFIWERSATYTHGFIVIPIFLYLLWRERKSLAALPPEPCYAALVGIAAAGAIWLVGELVNAAVVTQFAVMAMIPLGVWAVLGTRVVKALGIPLAFLFFAVPFGDFLVPTLMDWTADFTVLAVRASGVPVYREGNYFMIPSGRWSVVEACSGLRYLIASFMIGSLYAYLTYRSPVRRVTFIFASLVVPIIANWLRAYMIVMLGHLTSNSIAVGADHLVYGWIFFGLVMALLFWIGSRWREDDKPEPTMEGSNATEAVAAQPARRVWGVALAALALMALWQPLYAGLAREGKIGRAELAPIAGRNGWEAAPDPLSTWRPDVKGARAELNETFTKRGQRVGLHIAFFMDQTQHTKAITSQNQLVSSENRFWKQIGHGRDSVAIGGGTLDARSGLVTNDRERLAVWQWFWVDGRVTSSEYVAKLYQALSVLRGHGDPAAWVIVYTQTDRGEAEGRATLQSFTVDMLGEIDSALQRASMP